MRVIRYDNKWVSLDNRRLFVLRKVNISSIHVIVLKKSFKPDNVFCSATVLPCKCKKCGFRVYSMECNRKQMKQKNNKISSYTFFKSLCPPNAPIPTRNLNFLLASDSTSLNRKSHSDSTSDKDTRSPPISSPEHKLDSKFQDLKIHCKSSVDQYFPIKSGILFNSCNRRQMSRFNAHRYPDYSRPVEDVKMYGYQQRNFPSNKLFLEDTLTLPPSHFSYQPY